MKILKSFDTKIDSEELQEAIEKYGEGNVILVKRHRVLLLAPLFGIFLALCVCGLLLRLIHYQYYKESSALFWLIIFIYAYTTLSRCIHSAGGIIMNIIWQTTSKKKYVDNLKNAMKKQKSFERFLRHTFVTFSIHTCLMLLNATVPFIIIHKNGIGSIALAISMFIIDVVFLIILNRIMYRIINYEMNFNICTTDSLISYSQDGFLKTNEMKIYTSTIKIIQVSNEGLSGALLQYGNLYVHTDGDLNALGGKSLELMFIPHPKKIAKKLNSIIEMKNNNLIEENIAKTA